MAQGAGKKRITLIESEEAPDKIREAHPNDEFVEVEIVVRAPNVNDHKELAVAASLCSCRRVCIAIVEQ